MPICPECKTDQPKRKDGRCPACSTPVEIHKGYWFRTEIGSPTVALVELFENLVSEWQSNKRRLNVVWKIPRKSGRYKLELVSAERLLELAEYNYELAEKSLRFLFTDSQFNWKNRNTLVYIDADFVIALSVVRPMLEAKQEKESKSLKVLRQIEEMDDLFS